MEYVAKVEQVYGSDQRLIKAGQRFDVEPQDVDILLKLDRIKPPEEKKSYRTRQMKAGA